MKTCDWIPKKLPLNSTCHLSKHQSSAQVWGRRPIDDQLDMLSISDRMIFFPYLPIPLSLALWILVRGICASEIATRVVLLMLSRYISSTMKITGALLALLLPLPQPLRHVSAAMAPIMLAIAHSSHLHWPTAVIRRSLRLLPGLVILALRMNNVSISPSMVTR